MLPREESREASPVEDFAVPEMTACSKLKQSILSIIKIS